jgi:hypothetical protein
VQVKVSLTEPKPISTGTVKVDLAFDALEGVNILSPADDAYGLAWPDGGSIRMVTTSALAALGTEAGYPVMTFTVKIPPNGVNGATIPVHIDPTALVVTDANGQPYATKVKDGLIKVGAATLVEDVVPGSDLVQAGQPVSIVGVGFTPTTQLNSDSAAISGLTYVSPSQMVLRFASPTLMHGLAIRQKSSKATYYSYQRTTNGTLSAYAVLRGVEPMFPGTGVTAAAVDFPAGYGTNLQILGLQNSHLTPVTVTVGRVLASGAIESLAAPLTLDPATRAVLEMRDLFAAPCLQACSVTIAATDSMHVVGAVADPALAQVQIIRPR